MKKRDWIHLIIIFLLLGFSYFRYKNQTYIFNRVRFLLNTQIEINVVSYSKNAERLLENAFNMIEEYELKFSYYNPKSELYKINNSEKEIFEIDDEFYEILKLAEKVYYESNHLYDVTIGSSLDIWDFETGIIPDSLAISEALLNIGFDKLELREGFLYKPQGIKINLGSISKGFIIDKVIENLIEAGVKETFVNAGGDIRFYSNGKRKWRVGVQNPRDPFSRIATLRIPDLAIVTSGDYERFFISDEQRYHHIINPLTGLPTNITVSVTILSPTAFVADALATASMVMHPFEAIELIKTYPATEAIIYFFDANEEMVSLRTEGISRWVL